MKTIKTLITAIMMTSGAGAAQASGYQCEMTLECVGSTDCSNINRSAFIKTMGDETRNWWHFYAVTNPQSVFLVSNAVTGSAIFTTQKGSFEGVEINISYSNYSLVG